MTISSHIIYSSEIISLIDLSLAFIAFIIAFQSKKICKYLKDSKYKLFTWSFFLIGLAYIFKIFSNMTILYRVIITQPTSIIIILKQLNSIQLLQFISLLAHKFFLLLGFLLLFLIIFKTKKRSESFLFIYLSSITILLSIFIGQIFHLTLTIILICLTIYFYKNYKKNLSKTSLLVFKSFLLISFGNLILISINIYPKAHIIGEIFILIGFILLLKNHLSFKIKNDKKKNKTNSDKRYPRSSKQK